MKYRNIPVKIKEIDFILFILPCLKLAKRGYVSKIPVYKIFCYILDKLYTGCQWSEVKIDCEDVDKVTWKAVYWHFRKWSKDQSLEKVWKQSILEIKDDLNLSEINLDGTHTIAKKGGEDVAYQGRKKAKTSNILIFTEKQGYIIGAMDVMAGNHHDTFNIKENAAHAFTEMKRDGIQLEGAYLNADKAFDNKDLRKDCFNHKLIPNIDENPRNRKKNKKGRKRLFNEEVYKNRFTNEAPFAWIDKFRTLVIRYERKTKYWYALNCLAFAMVNLKSLI